VQHIPTNKINATIRIRIRPILKVKIRIPRMRILTSFVTSLNINTFVLLQFTKLIHNTFWVTARHVSNKIYNNLSLHITIKQGHLSPQVVYTTPKHTLPSTPIHPALSPFLTPLHPFIFHPKLFPSSMFPPYLKQIALFSMHSRSSIFMHFISEIIHVL